MVSRLATPGHQSRRDAGPSVASRRRSVAKSPRHRRRPGLPRIPHELTIIIAPPTHAPVLTPPVRAARALLRLEQTELAHRAHVSIVTIRRLEGAGGSERISPTTVESVRQVLEKAGAEFIPDGVRRRPPARPEADALVEDLRALSLRSAARLQGRQLLTDADLYDAGGLPA